MIYFSFAARVITFLLALAKVFQGILIAEQKKLNTKEQPDYGFTRTKG